MSHGTTDGGARKFPVSTYNNRRSSISSGISGTRGGMTRSSSISSSLSSSTMINTMSMMTVGGPTLASIRFHPYERNLFGAINCSPHNHNQNHHHPNGGVYWDHRDNFETKGADGGVGTGSQLGGNNIVGPDTAKGDGSRGMSGVGVGASDRSTTAAIVDDHTGKSGVAGSSSSSMGQRIKKRGPVLLELRRLELPPPPFSLSSNNQDGYDHVDEDIERHANFKINDDDDKDEDGGRSRHDAGGDGGHQNYHHRHNPYRYRTRTLAISRGLSSLGTNVSSTCLSFDPNQKSSTTNNNDTSTTIDVKCATGLSTGALCIHDLRDIDPTSSELIDSADDNMTATTAVSYFHHQRRYHRPASAVAWRSGGVGNGHVAIGLIGSANLGVNGTSGMAVNGGGSGNGTLASGNAETVTTMGNNHHHSKRLTFSNTNTATAMQHRGRSFHDGRTSNISFDAGLGGGGGGGGWKGGTATGTATGLDREYCCLIWDVETQGSSGFSKGAKQTPAHRLAHNSGVTSLSWISNGHLLAIGCEHHKNLQVYDLRVCGTNLPPISTHAHMGSVLGVESDPNRPTVFATFGSGTDEPVKLWDARNMESPLAEIKAGGGCSVGFESASKVGIANGGGGGSSDGISLETSVPHLVDVSAVAWDPTSSGTLCIATGSVMRYYDTRTNPSRPVLNRVTNAPGSLRCMMFQPSRIDDGDIGDNVTPNHHPAHSTTISTHSTPTPTIRNNSDNDNNTTTTTTTVNKNTSSDNDGRNLYSSSIINGSDGQWRRKSERALRWKEFERKFYPHRMLGVLMDSAMVVDLPLYHISPLAISRRDGRTIHTLGRHMFVGSTTEGPTALENVDFDAKGDISATMMQRAKGPHRYSIDASANLQMLTKERRSTEIGEELAGEEEVDRISVMEMEPPPSSNNRGKLWQLWSWVERVEKLCSDEKRSEADHVLWPAKSLIDSGVLRLLHMDVNGGEDSNQLDSFSKSPSLHCNVFDSPMRRCVLTACGWKGKFGSYRDVLENCEATFDFERSAALATWHGDLGEAVAALQRGADHIRLLLSEKKNTGHALSIEYANTLQLGAMCIAGYNGGNPDSDSIVWRKACESLLRQEDLAVAQSRAPYLKAICIFLLNVQSGSFDKTLNDEHLYLSDRVAFACFILPRNELKDYLIKCIANCRSNGNLEGILVTGLDKNGIQLLQAYVDTNSDVQTAALVSSRVVLPLGWLNERAICSEWLDSYREILNIWQMWQSRALFDVGRANLLRERQQADDLSNSVAQAGRGVRRSYASSHIKRQLSLSTNTNSKHADEEGMVSMFPAQLYARCNYCNTSLPLSKLRRQEGIGRLNSWLDRQKPVMSCCPNIQCRKPLPRCAICLLPLGCLNPYTEAKKAGERNRSRGSNGQNLDDLSQLANLPFAEWFTWCMRCKHGGHAHHLIGWFSNHNVCAVSGCNCQCQFDSTEKLERKIYTQKECQP